MNFRVGVCLKQKVTVNFIPVVRTAIFEALLPFFQVLSRFSDAEVIWAGKPPKVEATCKAACYVISKLCPNTTGSVAQISSTAPTSQTSTVF